MTERYDVILLGPTGVTGREVARYLARRAPKLGLRWAVAGRDRARIDDALGRVGARPDGILLADTSDRASIERLVARATVVANLVGPYARHGEVVYEACARSGTHELDLTGEIDWVREMIERHQGTALASGARLVPTCGFESLPFDLGTLVAASALHDATGTPVVWADVAVTIDHTGRLTGMADAVSGGTYTSGVEALRRGSGPGMEDPYVLDPPGTSHPVRARYSLRPRRHAGTGAWLGPVVPAATLNPPVVHRSAALLRAEGDRTFAPGFRYREGSVAESLLPLPGPPFTAAATATALSATQAGLGLLGRAPDAVRRPIADGLLRMGPKAGEGPRPEVLDDWSYRLDIRAATGEGDTVDVVVEAAGHPGYKSTATLVGEAALALADPGAPVPERAGFLTPATALGLGVLDRLREAGASFTVSNLTVIG